MVNSNDLDDPATADLINNDDDISLDDIVQLDLDDDDFDDPVDQPPTSELITSDPLPADRNTYRDLYPHTGRPKKFTLRERKFVRYYFIHNGNQKQAAQDAGYAHPAVAGCVLMKRPHIKAAIEQNSAHHLESQGLTAYRTLEELRRLTLFNPKDLYDENGDLKDINDLPDEVASAIMSIETAIGLDPEIGPVSKKKYKAHNKASAIKTTLTYLGLLPSRVQGSIEVNTTTDNVAEWFEYCTLEEKETIHDIMIRARGRMSAQEEE